MPSSHTVRERWRVVVACGVAAFLGRAGIAPAAGPVQLPPTPKEVEADWLRQAAASEKTRTVGTGVTPEEDAAGGCDGVITGDWGFHTQHEDDPWWQVDLGEVVALGRVVLYNRTECAGRSSRIRLLASEDGRDFREVYQHNGATFLGKADGKPLDVALPGVHARYVKLHQPGREYFHLDEVQVYPQGSGQNVALCRPATQSSTSQWSARHRASRGLGWCALTEEVLRRGRLLAESLRSLGVDVEVGLADLQVAEEALRAAEKNPRSATPGAGEPAARQAYFQARWAARRLALSNPLIDFDGILFVKNAPPMFPHMSDQYYGWWSRPGGGVYALEGLRGERPRLRCLTEGWAPGSFLRPDISHDGKRVLFAYAKYYPHIAAMEKAEKEKLPEDSFYKIFELALDGSGAKQLTRGRYDDFDARYLPNGEVVFLSTRKGRSVRCGMASAEATTRATLPDSYVRCGGDNWRPVPVFTLHVMDSGGRNLRAISAFENFEWNPVAAADGRILYARWDYIDRFNGHFMSLWSTNPDGTSPQLVYKNFTTNPQCVFEARPVPGSRQLIFTASAHHSNTGGSIALLDPAKGTEGLHPITRLTPEVCFPESEGWPESYYAGPFPLSEEYYLAAWGDRRLPGHAYILDEQGNPSNSLGLYLCDAFGNLELLYRDPAISSMCPIPVRPRTPPPVVANRVDWGSPQEGRLLVQDVYRGLGGVERGTVRRLRIVGVPPKIQPHMNSPEIGVSREDPGKFVLGTVPVEEDGSAFFVVPSGVPLFFQALDAEGLALQTMRTLTYVQPQQTLSCIGCHEPRDLAPPLSKRRLASARAPSRLTPGPQGSWPLRFDDLVQPVLDRSCVGCHRPGGEDPRASRLDLTAGSSWRSLVSFGDKDLEKLAFERDYSIVGECTARKSKLLQVLRGKATGHEKLELCADDFTRLVTWMDTYAQRQGSFGERQDDELRKLRDELRGLFEE